MIKSAEIQRPYPLGHGDRLFQILNYRFGRIIIFDLKGLLLCCCCLLLFLCVFFVVSFFVFVLGFRARFHEQYFFAKFGSSKKNMPV